MTDILCYVCSRNVSNEDTTNFKWKWRKLSSKLSTCCMNCLGKEQSYLTPGIRNDFRV